MESFWDNEEIQSIAITILTNIPNLQQLSYNRLGCVQLLFYSLVNVKDEIMDMNAVLICSAIIENLEKHEIINLIISLVFKKKIQDLLKILPLK